MKISGGFPNKLPNERPCLGEVAGESPELSFAGIFILMNRLTRFERSLVFGIPFVHLDWRQAHTPSEFHELSFEIVQRSLWRRICPNVRGRNQQIERREIE
jgi:hypothetical protein